MDSQVESTASSPTEQPLSFTYSHIQLHFDGALSSNFNQSLSAFPNLSGPSTPAFHVAQTFLPAQSTQSIHDTGMFYHLAIV